MNMETASVDLPNKNWIDKLIQILENLSGVFLAFPFVSLALWVLGSAFFTGDYFFFFPAAMLTFLPTGVFALLVQLFRTVMKRKLSLLGFLLLGASTITVLIGILAWMAVYVVTGG